MDDVDLRLLRLLVANGRASWAELGEAVGLSAPAAADRVKRLEERGILRGLTANVDPRPLGYGLTAFISVSVGGARDRAAFLDRVHALPEILECHHAAGDDDYVVKVRCKDTEDLERLLTRELKAHDGVVRTRTTIVLSTVKETAAPPNLVSVKKVRK